MKVFESLVHGSVVASRTLRPECLCLDLCPTPGLRAAQRSDPASFSLVFPELSTIRGTK